ARPGRNLNQLSKSQGSSSAIRKMCLTALPKYKEWLNQTYGNVSPEDANYGHEQLEREHGFVPQGIAAQRMIKSLTGQVEKASNMAESSGTLGGYAVPPDFRNNVLTIEEEESVI